MAGRKLATALALLCILASAATAQDLRPRALIVFDTSGSMLIDVDTGEFLRGDNSAEYPDNTGVSRLFVAKSAVRAVVDSRPPINFGLMRFPQREGVDINNGAGRFAYNAYANLMANPLNYIGECAGRLRQVDANSVFSLIVQFGADTRPAIVSWLDHVEMFPQNKELRAEGPTPLVESLRHAHEYYTSLLPPDPLVRCRRNYVILLTDGSESCFEPAAQRRPELVARATALRNMSVVVGGMPVAVDIRTFVIAFAIEPNQLADLDAAARAGGTAVNANGDPDPVAGGAYRANDADALDAALARILAEGLVGEMCNGRDDDCDGRVDEGSLNACGGCGAVPAEVCNARDEDCDGRVDEGVRNACGACGAVPVEACNARDDDCDGRVDEGVQNACGACGAVPAEVCNARDDDCDRAVDEGVRNACGACGAVPAEACNEVDDDCDGRVDEGFLNACGGCGPAPPERCNRADDDCDGRVDEGVLNACGGCGAAPPEVCNSGDDDCDGRVDEGVLNACGRCGAAPAERCNRADDDCDGVVDEGVLNACGACGAVPAEVCNAGDDDCDGTVDEGVQNACGRCGAVPAEVCDTRDDDCDGAVDEGVTNACGRCGPLPADECNGADDDCDGVVDEEGVEAADCAVPRASGRCVPGRFVCLEGEVRCLSVMGPAPEACNGRDDDCDAAIDEGDPQGGEACETPEPGACARGALACAFGAPQCRVVVLPGEEICNGEDDDCDAATDEGDPGGGAECVTALPGVCAPGVEACVEGGIGCVSVVAPAEEVCDGLDNDCDGAADEEFPWLGLVCKVGVGRCGRDGVWVCGADGGRACSGEAGAASAETCNAADDDCDGSIDEDFPDLAAPCAVGVGACRAQGAMTCAAGGRAVACDAVPTGAREERCESGVDEDCDGVVDEGECDDGVVEADAAPSSELVDAGPDAETDVFLGRRDEDAGGGGGTEATSGGGCACDASGAGVGLAWVGTLLLAAFRRRRGHRGP